MQQKCTGSRIGLVRELQELLDRTQSSFQVEELAGGYQLLTRPEFHPWLLRLRRRLPSISQAKPAAIVPFLPDLL